MVNPSSLRRTKTSLAVLVLCTMAWIAALSGLLYGVASVSRADLAPEARAYLVRLAYLAGGVLVVSGLLLAVWLFRYVRIWLAPPHEPPPRPDGLDAWAEAGRRLRPEDAPPIEGFEDPDAKG